MILKRGVCAICSVNTIADIYSAAIISALQEKYPPMHLYALNPNLAWDALLSTLISEDDVFHVIRSFPRGSAGGPDRIHLQHLFDLHEATERRCCFASLCR